MFRKRLSFYLCVTKILREVFLKNNGQIDLHETLYFVSPRNKLGSVSFRRKSLTLLLRFFQNFPYTQISVSTSWNRTQFLMQNIYNKNRH